MSEDHTMSEDEIHNVFPDPEGAKHPDRQKRPQTALDYINQAIRDIKFNRTWETRADGWYCLLCAPGGYRIRSGANPQMHEEQRNPDTHRWNLIWATLKWFPANGLSVPIWPDCYAEHHRGLWCHICRRIVGTYDREDGEAHDLVHQTMERVVMRPDRLRPKEKFGPNTKSRQRNMLDEILASRADGYDPEAEAAARRGQFGEPVPDPDRAPAVPGAFTASRGGNWQERLGYNYTDQSIPRGTFPAKNNETGQWEEVTQARLDEWIESGGMQWRAACALFDFCVTKGTTHPCIGEGCQCSCHRNADTQEGSYEPPIPPIVPPGPQAQ